MSNWPTKELLDLAINAVRLHGQDLLKAKPIDLQEYGATVPSVEFYAELLGALAYFESRFNTMETYTEAFADADGNRVVSRGLLQISIESANGYGAKLKEARELHNRVTNLRCGVLIMQRWILKDQRIAGRIGVSGNWLGMARYWSPFRKPDRIGVMRSKMKAIFKEKKSDQA